MLRYPIGGSAPPPQTMDVYSQKAEGFPAVKGSCAVLQERLRIELCHAFSAAKSMLTESLDGSLRRLLPKPLANHNASYSLAPTPMSLQNPRYFARIEKIDYTDSAAGSTGFLDTARRIAERARQASAANKNMSLQDQENQNGGAKGPAHPPPKVLISLVQKRESRRARGSRTAVACENCR